MLRFSICWIFLDIFLDFCFQNLWKIDKYLNEKDLRTKNFINEMLLVGPMRFLTTAKYGVDQHDSFFNTLPRFNYMIIYKSSLFYQILMWSGGKYCNEEMTPMIEKILF